MRDMDSSLDPPGELSVVNSELVEGLCSLLEDSVDDIRRVAAFQPGDEAIIE